MGTISRLLVLAMAIFIAVECGKALVIESPKKFEELPDWSVCRPDFPSKCFAEKHLYSHRDYLAPKLAANAVFGIETHECGQRITLFVLQKDGSIIATDPESKSGFKTWKASSDELAALHLALGKLKHVEKSLFECDGVCGEPITNITFTQDDQSRNIRIRGMFMGRSNIHTWLGRGTEVPQSIRDLYRTVVLTPRTGATMWPKVPDFVEVKVSNLDGKVGRYCYEMEQHANQSLKEFLELKCRPTFVMARSNCSPFIFGELMELELSKGNSKIGNHIYSFDATYR